MSRRTGQVFPRIVQSRIILAFYLTLWSAILPGCELRKPVRIGFAAEISGKQSEAGIELRNGVQMAVSEINAAGGMNGRKIELLVEDDLGTPDGARAAQQRLADAGVVAVIGHFTSSQTMAGLEVTQARGILMLSATAATSLLSGKQDLFFRTVASTDLMGKGIAEYICNRRGLAQVTIVLDEDNQAYSLPMADAFSEHYKSLGCQAPGRVHFSGAESPNFSPLVIQARASNADGVLIIASPLNTAMIAQAIVMQGWSPALFSSAWGQGKGLIQNGGKAIESMEFVIGFDVNDPDRALATFKDNYQDHFTYLPIYSAMEGYETMLLLGEALSHTGGSAEGLPEALLALDDFQGLTGPIRMDDYGDAVRPLVIQRVVEREFITIDTIAVEN